MQPSGQPNAITHELNLISSEDRPTSISGKFNQCPASDVQHQLSGSTLPLPSSLPVNPLPCRMDPRPRLPHDVLLTIASFADTNSLRTLLATSHSLHIDCGKYVLRHPVVLGGNLKIVSFIYFMRPHKHSRWRHLHSLYLCDKPISPRIAKAFARVIPRASHLEYLEFEHAENTLGAHPDLPLAFAALPAVKAVVIDHGYQHACRMLEAMHWPLESVELMHSRSDFQLDWFAPDRLDRMHPAALLKNSRATLKSLKCYLWTEFNDILDTYPVYPRLESLHLEGVGCPSAAQWAISHPNLKRLHLSTFNSYSIWGSEDPLGQNVPLRLQNLEDHAAQEQRWIELEHFEGYDVVDLYLLGLPCRVRDVDITLSQASLPFFAPAMETAGPTALGLSITSDLFSQPVPTYLEDPGLADVKHLWVDAMVYVSRYGEDTGDIDMDRYMGYVLHTLHRVSAQKFAFSLNVDSSYDRLLSDHDTDDPDEQGEQPMDSPPPPRVLSPVEIWAEDVDLDALARHFLDEVSSLEWVQLSVNATHVSCRKDAESSRRGGDPTDS